MAHSDKLIEAGIQLAELEQHAKQSGNPDFIDLVREMGANLVNALKHVGQQYDERMPDAPEELTGGE